MNCKDFEHAWLNDFLNLHDAVKLSVSLMNCPLTTRSWLLAITP